MNNSDTLDGGTTGIFARGPTDIDIINSGFLTADSLLAIQTRGASTEILNAGTILGFVDLTDEGDTFINQTGGTFEARGTSSFNIGTDLFVNEDGATVHTAGAASLSENTAFEGLERFENRGLISLVDGAAGDEFRIANTPGGTNLEYIASGNSTVAVDAFLGPPGSVSDLFIVEGNVGGRTLVTVNNTNPGPGTFNPAGIPVVIVTGTTDSNAFYLSAPIDTGFFNYDLFFEPTGTFELRGFEARSFLSPGAFVLPQLVTATQDIWHAGAETWFDRTADLRRLLSGSRPVQVPQAKNATGQASAFLNPALWARASANWLDRSDTETINAYGRDYRYDLDRNLQVLDFEAGIDFGERSLIADGDALIFGVLGGYVDANLDYQMVRNFDFAGGQIGGYATYLKNGLFIDTLLNVHLLELGGDDQVPGFPGSLDVNNIGLRTDAGYRFGDFKNGAFIEPLATVSVNWVDIEGFSLDGNTVSFDDHANVRGRLGVRVGTSSEVQTGTTMEPFIIASAWGTLTDDNRAMLTSSGTDFLLVDDLEGVWGEVSGGVNVFNPGAQSSLFAKLDVAFGEDLAGFGGKAGLRFGW